MSHSGSEPRSPLPYDRHAESSNRRVFMKRMIGGLAIGAAAFRVLANPAAASAETRNLSQIPDGCTGSCLPCGPGNTYNEYAGHGCGAWEFLGTCPKGDFAECIGKYNVYSSITGQFCRSFFDEEGPCSPG
jgi:hypothetical protein